MKLEKMVAAVAEEFNLDNDGVLAGPIRSSSLRPLVRDARQALCLLARRHTSSSLAELSEALKLSQALLLHGEARAKARLADDDFFCQAVNDIERRLIAEPDMSMHELSKAINQLSRIAAKLQDAAKDLKAVLEAHSTKRAKSKQKSGQK